MTQQQLNELVLHGIKQHLAILTVIQPEIQANPDLTYPLVIGSTIQGLLTAEMAAEFGGGNLPFDSAMIMEAQKFAIDDYKKNCLAGLAPAMNDPQWS